MAQLQGNPLFPAVDPSITEYPRIPEGQKLRIVRGASRNPKVPGSSPRSSPAPTAWRRIHRNLVMPLRRSIGAQHCPDLIILAGELPADERHRNQAGGIHLIEEAR